LPLPYWAADPSAPASRRLCDPKKLDYHLQLPSTVHSTTVSLDEHHDIPIPQAQELIDGLREFFEPVGEVPPLATAAMAPSALLTTRLDPADWPDWPWRFSLRTRAIMLKHRRWPFPLTPKLTVYGSSWRRRS